MSWRSTGLHSTEAEEVNPENSHIVRGDKVVLLVGLHEADLLETRVVRRTDRSSHWRISPVILSDRVVHSHWPRLCSDRLRS